MGVRGARDIHCPHSLPIVGRRRRGVGQGGGIEACRIIAVAGIRITLRRVVGQEAEEAVARAALDDLARGDIGAVLGVPGGLFLLAQRARIAVIPIFAVLLAEEILGRRKVRAPSLLDIVPPDRLVRIGIERSRLTKLTIAIARVFRGGRRGRGELDQPRRFGADPLLAGPACAGGGIEIAGVDRLGEIGVGAQPFVGAGERADRGEIVLGGGFGAGAEEQAGAGRAAVAPDQIEILVEILRDQPRGGMSLSRWWRPMLGSSRT